MPSWAGLTVVSAIAVAEKAIGHAIAHSVILVPDTVENCSKAARFKQPIHQNHSLRKGSMMMRKEKERQRRRRKKHSLTGLSRHG
jgi:hypothetical protein